MNFDGLYMIMCHALVLPRFSSYSGCSMVEWHTLKVRVPSLSLSLSASHGIDKQSKIQRTKTHLVSRMLYANEIANQEINQEFSCEDCGVAY